MKIDLFCLMFLCVLNNNSYADVIFKNLNRPKTRSKTGLKPRPANDLKNVGLSRPSRPRPTPATVFGTLVDKVSRTSRPPRPSISHANTIATESSPNVVKCYCNLPHCILRGYTCISTKGGGACFSKEIRAPGHGRQSKSPSSSNTHPMPKFTVARGCVEMLSQRDHEQCMMQPHQQHYGTSQDALAPQPSGTPQFARTTEDYRLPRETETPQDHKTSLEAANSRLHRNPKENMSLQFDKTPEDTETPRQHTDPQEIGSPEIHRTDKNCRKFSAMLQCCNKDNCNIASERTLIIREIDAPSGPPALPPRLWWVTGPTTIGVTIAGVIILAFLFLFASRILTEDKAKVSSTQFLQNSAKDTYSKIPHFTGTTPAAFSPADSADSAMCSILCLKSQQKKQDVIDYCRSLPLSSAANRLSLSCPSSLYCSRDGIKRNSMQPLTPRRRPTQPLTLKGDSVSYVDTEEIVVASQGVEDKLLASQGKDCSLVAKYEQRDSLLASQEELDSLVARYGETSLVITCGDSLLANQNEDHSLVDR